MPEPTTGPDEFRALRDLLVGPERQRIDRLEHEVNAGALTPEALAEHLPEAIARRAGQDRQLARALGPTVETAITESIRRNPTQITTAIFPVIGPAIRKAIAEAMSGLVLSVNTAIEHSFSARGLKWRWEALRTGIPFSQIVIRHALLYRVEQVFLIHTETGLLLAHAAPPELKVADADLISGMLTAIQDFVGDSFKTAEAGGRLRTFSVGELTVVVEAGPQAVLAAVVRGQAPDSLVPRLQDTLEHLHFQLANQFAGFDGNAAPFKPAQPALEACLETVLSTHGRARRSGRGRRLVWAVPILLLVGAAAWISLRSTRTWNAALARLRAEPGLVLVSADRSGGRWHLAGLRDPLAPDPRVLLAGIGIDTSRVDGDFSAYLSLQPELVIARARTWLAAPETVTLTLRGDTLVGRGSAPVGWPDREGAPLGVTVVNVDSVVPVLPAEADAHRVVVERSRAFFEPGSAEIQGALATIQQVATAFQGLIAATGGHRFLRIDVVGRTDPSGTDALNQALSRLRAEAVGRRLVALGVPAAVMTPTGVGTAQPLAPSDAAELGRTNRSVSFVVRVVRVK